MVDTGDRGTCYAGASQTVELMVPWARHGVVHDIHSRCQVLGERHDEHGTTLTVRAPEGILRELTRELAEPKDA